jgi:hypothetical protein
MKCIAFLALAAVELASAQPRGSGACRVASLERVGDIGAGLEWHPTDLNKIAIARPDSAGNSQVYIIRPDGSEIRCLTCNQTNGGPPVNVHKGVPHWDSTGKYIFMQVEQALHSGGRAMALPGSGRWNDVWVTTTEGDRWWQLTDESSNKESGTLFPVPSYDGTKLAWAERFAGPRHPFMALEDLKKGHPPLDIWGRWRLAVADIDWSGGHIRLRNIRRFTPGNGDFYEMQEWTKDNKGLLFSSSIGNSSPYSLDVWRYDLDSGKITPILNNKGQWQEHVSLSPSGLKIAYMSTECCRSWSVDDLRTLAAELYIMNTDGSDRVKLTDFNDREGQSVVAKAVWSPDGRRIALARILIAKATAEKRPADLWLLTFAGDCGR